MIRSESDDFTERWERDLKALPLADRERVKGGLREFGQKLAHLSTANRERTISQLKRLGLSKAAVANDFWLHLKMVARHMSVDAEEFFDMTPRELSVLLDLKIAQQEPSAGAAALAGSPERRSITSPAAAARIRAFMHHNALTQSGFAYSAKISERTLRHLLNAPCAASKSTWIQLAKSMNITVDALLSEAQ